MSKGEQGGDVAGFLASNQCSTPQMNVRDLANTDEVDFKFHSNISHQISNSPDSHINPSIHSYN
jgi:hypothetical protein